MLGRCSVVALLAVACTTTTVGPAESGFQQGQSGAPPNAAPQPMAAGNPSVGDAGCAAGQVCQPQPGDVKPLGVVGSDPNALTNIIAGALAGASATIGALTGGENAILEQGIAMKARTDARNMRPEGQLISAKLAPDGHASAALTLEPNRCYTIVGFAGPGVFTYQINVLTAPPLPPQVLAQSKAEGADPTVGANEQCIKSPYPAAMPVKIDMHVMKGQGLVGARVYRR
jgi:hypothetical protein